MFKKHRSIEEQVKITAAEVEYGIAPHYKEIQKDLSSLKWRFAKPYIANVLLIPMLLAGEAISRENGYTVTSALFSALSTISIIPGFTIFVKGQRKIEDDLKEFKKNKKIF